MKREVIIGFIVLFAILLFLNLKPDPVPDSFWKDITGKATYTYNYPYIWSGLVWCTSDTELNLYEEPDIYTRDEISCKGVNWKIYRRVDYCKDRTTLVEFWVGQSQKFGIPYSLRYGEVKCSVRCHDGACVEKGAIISR